MLSYFIILYRGRLLSKDAEIHFSSVDFGTKLILLILSVISIIALIEVLGKKYNEVPKNHERLFFIFKSEEDILRVEQALKATGISFQLRKGSIGKPLSCSLIISREDKGKVLEIVRRNPEDGA